MIDSLQAHHQKMDLMSQMKEKNSVTFKPAYVQLGSNYFMHKAGKQRENGMQMVHQIDHVTLREYIKGIKADDLEFYDKYPNCKEVMIMGSANSGKSTLINALNGAYQGIGADKLAYTSKNKGKTYQLHFYHCRHRHHLKSR